jgi:hypothetical protein
VLAACLAVLPVAVAVVKPSEATTTGVVLGLFGTCISGLKLLSMFYGIGTIAQQ